MNGKQQFVLSGTVVSMEMEVDFPKVVVGEKVVQEADTICAK